MQTNNGEKAEKKNEIIDVLVLITPNNTLTLTSTTLLKSVNSIVNEFELDPLLVSFGDTHLYFNKNEFIAYLNNEISKQELITNTSCTGIFRNKEAIINKKNNVIDPGALWIQKKNKLILCDNNQFFTVKYNESLFESLM